MHNIEKIQQDLPSLGLVLEKDSASCPIVWVKPKDLIEFLRYLKETSGFQYQFLSDLTAYDDQGSEFESQGRFVIVYNLFSPSQHSRIRVKTRTDEETPVPSAISIWAGANWAEREVFDMFGVRFSGHPDLRRILMDQRWVGHPLRKDYYWRKYQLFVNPEPIPEDLLSKGIA